MPETIAVKSIEDFTRRIEMLEETDFYRGHSNPDHKLVPSIGRLGFTDLGVLTQFESQIFNDFKRKSYAYTSNIPSDDFEWLFLAQHHGLPTRLLDWTYNPLVSLFFAIENESQTDACVYRAIANPVIPSSEYNNWKTPFNIRLTAGLIPNLKHPRYHSQSGLFTIHPNPLEEDQKIILTKYVIPFAHKSQMRWRLRKLGISKSVVFPSLDSLSHDVLQMNLSKYQDYIKK